MLMILSILESRHMISMDFSVFDKDSMEAADVIITLNDEEKVLWLLVNP